MLAILVLAGGTAPVWGEKGEPSAAAGNLEELTATCLRSAVVIYQEGRDARPGATGSGFLISEDGLIATNWHVINDGRQLSVELRDGTRADVTEVHAWDRRLDLAVIRIDADRDLSALPLGDSDELNQGQAVAALGNPRGLKFSVVQGVVSAFRDDVGDSPFPMIQLAIPVEQGNSGGPLLDMEGNVQGVISLKSMVTANLGFAMPVNALKLLLEKPNPMPMERWATIGALNDRLWRPLMGARWSQRAGKIVVKGRGNGFGGRSLCLSTRKLPGKAYQVEVEVRLDDEAGAAGLVFASDGGQAHYGFYPTGGRVRLTRFEGPDVMSWEILEQQVVNAYRLGDWNRLRVRVEPEEIICFVNGEEVLRSSDARLRGGKVGLCKFRQTEAEFRGFRLGESLGREGFTEAQRERMQGGIRAALEEPGPGDTEEVFSLARKHPELAKRSFEEEKRKLEEKMARLGRLERDAHASVVATKLVEVLQGGDADIDLFHAGLLVAKLDNPGLDIAPYQEELDRMAEELREELPGNADEAVRVEAVLRYLFEENGFHGSRLDYYHESNSYLNEVIDDREGIPITLSVLFLELSRRVGAETVYGVGLPGRFVAGYEPEPETKQLLDIYEGGKPISDAEARAMARNFVGGAAANLSLEPESPREVILRMLRNLINLRKQQDRPEEALPYLEVTLAIEPETVSARLDRMILRFQEGNRSKARADLRWLLQNEPPGLDLVRLRQFLNQM